jgi:membrane AbrB-like protein
MRIRTRMSGNQGSGPFWSTLLLAYAVTAALFVQVKLPSPYLFAGAVAGAACALRMPKPQPFPPKVRRVGLAVIGVGAGSQISAAVLRTVIQEPIAIFGAIAGTIAVTMLLGQLLRLSPHITGPTAVFASIAGGAAGVAAVARELDADETVVLTIQYLRVLFVLATVPIVAPFLGATGSSKSPTDAGFGISGISFTAAALVIGLGLALVLTFSASFLILPLVAAAALSVASVFPSNVVPPLILAFGYATTGLQVGLSFTPETFRRVGRLMPLAIVQVVLSVVGCAAVGLGYSKAAGVSALDGYLATTPGGLPAVIAIAIGSGASVGVVMTMQIVRIFTCLLLAPVLGTVFKRRGNLDFEPESA